MRTLTPLRVLFQNSSLRVILALSIFGGGCAGGPRLGAFRDGSQFEEFTDNQTESSTEPSEADSSPKVATAEPEQEQSVGKSTLEEPQPSDGEQTETQRNRLLAVISGRDKPAEPEEIEGDPFLESADATTEEQPTQKPETQTAAAEFPVKSADATSEDSEAQIAQAVAKSPSPGGNQFSEEFDSEFARLTEELRNPSRQTTRQPKTGGAAPFPELVDKSPAAASQPKPAAVTPQRSTHPLVNQPTSSTPPAGKAPALPLEVVKQPAQTPVTVTQPKPATVVSTTNIAPTTSNEQREKPGIIELSETTPAESATPGNVEAKTTPETLPVIQPRSVLPQTLTRIPHLSSGVNSVRRPRRQPAPHTGEKVATTPAFTEEVAEDSATDAENLPIHPAFRHGIVPTVVREGISEPKPSETNTIDIIPASNSHVVKQEWPADLPTESSDETSDIVIREAGAAQRVFQGMILESETVPSRFVNPGEFAELDIQSLQDQPAAGTAPWISPDHSDVLLQNPAILRAETPDDTVIEATPVSSETVISEERDPETETAVSEDATAQAPAPLIFPTVRELQQVPPAENDNTQGASEFSESLRRQSIWVSANSPHRLNDGPLPYPPQKSTGDDFLPTEATSETTTTEDAQPPALILPAENSETSSELNVPSLTVPELSVKENEKETSNGSSAPTLNLQPVNSSDPEVPSLSINPLDSEEGSVPNLSLTPGPEVAPLPPLEPQRLTLPNTNAAEEAGSVIPNRATLPAEMSPIPQVEQRIINVENWEDEPAAEAKAENPISWVLFGLISLSVMALVSLAMRMRTKSLRR